MNMKKILLATAALAFMFTSCNHEPDFDGFQEYTPDNLVKLQLTYGGTYTGANGFNQGEDNSDDPKAVAKTKIEEWLNKNYYTAEKGSEATVKYNLIQKETIVSEISALDVDFQRNVTVYDVTEIPGWTNFILEGTNTWQDQSYSGNTYTQCGNVKANTVNWFISPNTMITKGDLFSFDVCTGYYKGDVLSVLISEDYVGAASKANLERATWVDVTSGFNIPKEPVSGYGKLATAGTMNMDKYAGKNVYIAFKYSGSSSINTTIQLDNIKVSREESVTNTNTVEKEARAKVDNNESKWTVSLPSEIAEVVLDENFESGVAYEKVVLNGWLNALLQGSYDWEYRSFSGNLYANISANKHEGVLENWLMTPALKLGMDMVLKFDMKLGYYNGDAFSVMVSEDFNGEPGSIASSTWTDLTSSLVIDKSSVGGYDSNWTNHTIDLSAYTGKTIYIGFKYLGNGTKGDNLVSTTYQLDNIYVGIPK